MNQVVDRVQQHLRADYYCSLAHVHRRILYQSHKRCKSTVATAPSFMRMHFVAIVGLGSFELPELVAPSLYLDNDQLCAGRFYVEKATHPQMLNSLINSRLAD